MARQRIVLALALALGSLASPRAGAEIYSWTDAAGHTHYTEDLQSVPPEQRGAARERAATDPGPSKVQTYATPPGAATPAAPRHHAFAARGDPGAPRQHRIPVARAGNSMIVQVRLNDRVVAPFVVDTGASYVLVPKAVADEAGIEVGPDARRMQFGTANGVIEQAMVTLDSVELGTARAEEVPASISPTMTVGLLGLSFFNRFTYQIDAANGVLTLVENDLVESGALRGGRSETQWRNEFDALRQRIEAIEARRRETPSTDGRLADALEEQRRAVEQSLDQLESEADDAHVPDAWRR